VEVHIHELPSSYLPRSWVTPHCTLQPLMASLTWFMRCWRVVRLWTRRARC